jgi:hypothetical protein
LVRYPGRAAFVALIIWFVVAINRYIVAPRAVSNYGASGETLLLWLVVGLVGFGGTFYYLLARTPNPPLAAGRFGVYAVVLKLLFDLGLASALEREIPPTAQQLLRSTDYWLEMVILILCAYLAGQLRVRARRI